MKGLFSAAIAGSICIGTSAAPIIIDNFTGGATTIDTDPGTGFASSVDQSGIAGVIGSGDRNLAVTDDGLSASAHIRLTIDTVAGASLNSSDTGEAGTWSFDYGADTALGSLDLTDGGTNSWFDVIFKEAEADAIFSITVYDSDSSDTVTRALSTDGDFAIFTPFAFTVLFSEFTGIDFTDVDRVTFLLDGTASRDYQLDSFVAEGIPAPAALPAGLALLAVMGFARRRRLA